MAEEKNTLEQNAPQGSQPKQEAQKKPAKKPRKNASAHASRRENEKKRRAAAGTQKRGGEANNGGKGSAPAAQQEETAPAVLQAAQEPPEQTRGAAMAPAEEAGLPAAAPQGPEARGQGETAEKEAERPAVAAEAVEKASAAETGPAAGAVQEPADAGAQAGPLQQDAATQAGPAPEDAAAAPGENSAPGEGTVQREDTAPGEGTAQREDAAPGEDTAPGEGTAQREDAAPGEEDGAAQSAQEEAQPKTGKRSKRARKRHYFAFYVAVCTGVVVLASALSIFVMFFATGNPLFSTTQDVELPNFYNMTQEEIEANEAYSSFRIEFVDVYSDEVAEGHVVDQSPKPPKEVKENARITVRVSKGVEQVEVPDMVGWTRTSASEKVKSINLSILIKYETDDSKPYNTVLSTSPAAGTVMEAGETLTVYINREELAVGTTIAPNCVGLSQSAAGRLLTSRGLSYSFIKVDSASPEGYVVSQSPRSGESMAQGGSVTLRVSNGLGSGDGTIRDPNVADGSVTGHHHTWVAWQDGHWICTVCNAVK